MALPALVVVAVTTAVVIPLLIYYFLHTKSKKLSYSLPPGSLGWPLIGETVAFLRAMRRGKPEDFVRERMEIYGNNRVFKTSLLGERTVVFCGSAGNKFLFGNENKLVRLWWPSSIQRLFGPCILTAVGDDVKRIRRILSAFLDPDALSRYIRTMDVVAQRHIKAHWEGKEELKVYPTSKKYTFELACRLFLSYEDPELISKLCAQFMVFLKGVAEIPLNIPGTRFYRAMRAADAIRKDIGVIIKQRRSDLEQKKASPSQDLLSHLLVTSDESGSFLTEQEIVNNILVLLFAGHDTAVSVISLIFKCLAELPQVYGQVLAEQIEIAESKGEELLQWEDIQKMKYSWQVVSEVMRLTAPVAGGFREALVDFTYEGYTIPKGWKLHFNIRTTHIDPRYFRNTTEFDPSRFEGTGLMPFSYLPFGGGPRMCIGKEYARLEILIFLHNIVKRFKWELKIPNEEIEYDPMAAPAKGLPIQISSHDPIAA